ncbi:MAG: hypothetical protein HYW22_02920 [Candidatus Aenigmarchaeota archaeon]|nr:hypothetical protein [Candidatus Aenigmarchaeota archaeon]
MRAAIPIFILTVFLISGFALADATIQASFTTTPSSLAPGTDGYVQISLKNAGSTDATNVKISATNVDAGIIIKDAQSAQVGGVGAGQTATILFKISTDSSLQSGQYKIGFNIDYCQGSSCNTALQYAIVTVSSPSLLEIKSISPSTINIGTQTNLTLTLVNNGNDKIENIVMTWNEPNNKILPLGSDNRIIIPSISAKASLDIPLTVITSSDITSGIKYLTFNSKYSDKSGSLQNVNSTVGILVGGKTDFDISYQDFNNGVFSFSIANIGLNPAKSVSVKIPDQDVLLATDSKSVFLGDLNPGDFSTANFKLVPKDLSKTKITLQAQLTYTDESGVRQVENHDIMVNLQKSSIDYFKSTNGGPSIILILLVAAAIGFIYWKFIKRKKK